MRENSTVYTLMFYPLHQNVLGTKRPTWISVNLQKEIIPHHNICRDATAAFTSRPDNGKRCVPHLPIIPLSVLRHGTTSNRRSFLSASDEPFSSSYQHQKNVSKIFFIFFFLQKVPCPSTLSEEKQNLNVWKHRRGTILTRVVASFQ